MLGLTRRDLGKSGCQVTFLGFGALEIGRDWGLGTPRQKARPPENIAGQVLNGVLDLGINLIDTASAYHASEQRIGKYISHRRKEYFLASKCGEHNNEPGTYYNFSYKAVKTSIEKSLTLLKTDYIDLMQIHFGPNPQKVLDDGETLAAMKDAKKEGKIRLLGASCSGETALRCINSGDFDVMQLEISLLNKKDEPLAALCAEKGIGVIVRGGLGYGKLTPKVIPFLEQLDERTRAKVIALLISVNGDPDRLTALALRYLYDNPNISSVLVGSKNLEHIKKNLELLETDVDEKAMEHAKAME